MTYEAFRDTYRISLNAQQEAAVRQGGGPVLLLAVPGSGKTTVIVARLGYLIHCMGVDPRRILTVTYTVAATADMRRRYAAVFGEEERLTFKTINALCAAIIRRYAALYGRTPFQLLSEPGGVERILRGCYTAKGWGYPSDAELKEAQTKIAYCKNMCSTQEEIGAVQLEGADFPALYQTYCDTMRRRRLMDFDDQMVIALQILRRYPDLLAEFQHRWQYIHVDEAQDTSKIQHILLQLLAAGHRNLFLVGDEDQSIYGFRAAYPQALLDFDTRYPDAKILLMETNYRSTGAILDRAAALIAHNTSRRPKQLRTVRPGGKAVRRQVFGDCREQYFYLAKLAQQNTGQTAVLYRNNDSALPLIDLLTRQKIPYYCRQRDSLFFSHPIVQDLTEILRFSTAPEDHTAFLKLYYKLGLRIKKEVLSQLLPALPAGPILRALASCNRLEPWQAAKADQLHGVLVRLPRLSTLEALTQILYSMGYLDYLRDRGGDTGKVDILLALASQHPDRTEFLDRLAVLEELVRQGGGGGGSFLLSTIHASKGLEYDQVILMDVIDGIFPAVSLSSGVYSLENRAALEEERRLFYVGVTRAKSQLEVLDYQTRFGVPTPGSSFLRELLEEPETAEQSPTLLHKLFGKKGAPRLAAYKPGVRVVHKSFGPGAVNSRQGGIVTLALDRGGVKRVDLAACLKKNLLWLEEKG